MRLTTFRRVFSASPFATRTGGKSTMARGRWPRRAATGSFITFWLSGKVKTPSHVVEYSMRRSCAVWYCATQTLCDRILPVQDRASCLPESSRQALVADAREIRQYQMHPTSPRTSVTEIHSVTLFSFSPGATFTSVLRMRPLEVFPPQFLACASFPSRSRLRRHKRVFSADAIVPLAASASLANCPEHAQ